MNIYTIGFTKKSAEQFFTTLRESGAKRIVDVRLRNVSQLAGFAKQNDLAYFAKAICGIEYVHLPELAPTPEILDAYRKQRGGWTAYERDFMTLLRNRRIERTVSKEVLSGGCLLCSEDKPYHCHRRLVAEYLRDAWGGVEIRHLG